MKQNDFDVVVIGGGHAGCEAAHAAARKGARTALISLRRHDLGVMSCNPAIGGLGKGHIVREIDALDGIMGIAADRAGIQFRLLNRKKGPAVQGPRTQADRSLYRQAVQDLTAQQPNLEVVEGEVVDLLLQGRTVRGVVLRDGSQIAAKSVVLTTGTFLRGVIHIGDVSKPGGRMGDDPSVLLAERLENMDLSFGRLKTGTPPRLDGKTIDWRRLESQDADEEPEVFSFLHSGAIARQISCGITHTNDKTHDIIRSNLHRSSMYGGHIEGVGPRYCPSIEDKVVRFADKTSHQIFLEPEGLDDDTVYPNGISTSLPVDTQESYIKSIVGLENAHIIQPGYAIEYDYVDPRSLSVDLSVNGLEGFFLAGQINGTTGYEEAAGQGLVAGLNAAAHSLGHDSCIFERSTSYIGVMIDDLTTHGVVEPYRMFTSRAEYRLSLRADNADQRLTAWGRSQACVRDKRWAVFQEKVKQLQKARTLLTETVATARDLAAKGVKINADGPKRSLLDALSISGTSLEQLVSFDEGISMIAKPIGTQIERDALYSHYIERQRSDLEALKRDTEQVIPDSMNYLEMVGLSAELKSKLNEVRPSNIAQASRIDGMTPAALMLLTAKIRTTSEKRQAS